MLPFLREAHRNLSVFARSGQWGYFLKTPVLSIDLGLFDTLIGSYICRRSTLPCKGNCVNWHHVNEIAEFVYHRARELRIIDSFRRMVVAEALPILRNFVQTTQGIVHRARASKWALRAKNVQVCGALRKNVEKFVVTLRAFSPFRVIFPTIFARSATVFFNIVARSATNLNIFARSANISKHGQSSRVDQFPANFLFVFVSCFYVPEFSENSAMGRFAQECQTNVALRARMVNLWGASRKNGFNNVGASRKNGRKNHSYIAPTYFAQPYQIRLSIRAPSSLTNIPTSAQLFRSVRPPHKYPFDFHTRIRNVYGPAAEFVLQPKKPSAGLNTLPKLV